MQKQKQISNFLDLELKKINDKVLTLKYVHPIITSGPTLKKTLSLNAHPQTLRALKSRRQRPVHKNIQFIQLAQDVNPVSEIRVQRKGQRLFIRELLQQLHWGS